MSGDLFIACESESVSLRINTMPAFNSCTKCVGSPGIIHDRTPDDPPVSWAWMTSQLNVALIRKPRGSLMCLADFSDMLSMGVFTTGHRQTSGRMVHEIDVYTVLTTYSCSFFLMVAYGV